MAPVPPLSAPDALLGQLVGEYRLEALLGRGAFGAVYLGQHSSLPSLRVAVKVAHRALAGDQDFVAALRAECASLPFLKHENVATFMQFVSEGPLAPALVLELVEGGSLETRLQQGKQDPAKVWRWLEELLGGLSAADVCGLVHRDIKPDNVLLTDKGSVRLVDFGLARAAERGSSNTATSLAGTLEYVAPEVANGDTASPAADVYAVGLLCWELLMGERACLGGKVGAPAAKILWHVTKGPEALGPRADVLGIPSNLAGLVDELCAKEVGRRPANAAAALARLHTVRMVGVGTPGPESVGRVPRPAGSGEQGTGPVAPPKVGSGPPPANGLKPAPAPPPTVAMPTKPTSPPPQTVQASLEVGKGQENAPAPKIPAPPRPNPPTNGSNAGLWVVVVVLLCLLVTSGVLWMRHRERQERVEAELRERARVEADRRAVSGSTWIGRAGYPMRGVPSGIYELGCTLGLKDCYSDEVGHSVELTRHFYLGETEVTQGLWRMVTGERPWRRRPYWDGEERGSSCATLVGEDDSLPVVCVTWAEAATFANRLSRKEGIEECYVVSGDHVEWPKGLACNGYRLPTEAEWEVGARAGNDTVYAGGNVECAVGNVANLAFEIEYRSRFADVNKWNFANCSDGYAWLAPVGRFAPNLFGLKDMSGNVMEWVWDNYFTYPKHSVDPRFEGEGDLRVARGGSWDSGPADSRTSNRSAYHLNVRFSTLGLRLARTIP